MYENENYNAEIEAIIEKAKALEDAWLGENKIKREPILKKFKSPIRPYQPNFSNWAAKDVIVPKYPPCPRCSNREFTRQRVLDGVRHNGDGYGAIYESCARCGYTVYWLYDEA